MRVIGEYRASESTPARRFADHLPLLVKDPGTGLGARCRAPQHGSVATFCSPTRRCPAPSSTRATVRSCPNLTLRVPGRAPAQRCALPQGHYLFGCDARRQLLPRVRYSPAISRRAHHGPRRGAITHRQQLLEGRRPAEAVRVHGVSEAVTTPPTARPCSSPRHRPADDPAMSALTDQNELCAR